MPDSTAAYDKWPFIAVKAAPGAALVGWDKVYITLLQHILAIKKTKKIIVLDYYQGVLEDEVDKNLFSLLPGHRYNANDYLHTEENIQQLVYPDVTDDAIFGYITRLEIKDFFDPEKVQQLHAAIAAVPEGTVLIHGIGAAWLYPHADLLVYFEQTEKVHNLVVYRT